LTALFAGATGAVYGLICLGEASTWDSSESVQTTVTRLLMIAAVAVCGAIYRQVEADRRQSMTPPELTSQIETDLTAAHAPVLN